MKTIDSKKLLPPSKAFSSRMKNKKVLIPASNIRVKKNANIPSEDLKKGNSDGISSNSLLGIQNILSKIEGALLKSSLFQKKDQDNKRKNQEREKRKKREAKLEKKPTDKNIASGIASLPSLSFIDRIKKFLFWTILGRFFSDLVPKLIEFSKIILPAVDFIEKFAGNILKGVVDFIEWGYIAYDKVRDLSKQIGGENAQKVFDDFSKHFNTFINLALIAAMAGSSIGGGGGDKPGKPGPGKPGAPGQPGGGKKPTAAERSKNARIRDIQRKYGPNARKIYENALNNGKTPKQAEAAMQKGLKRGISIRPGADSLSAKTAKPGSIFKGGFKGLKKVPSRLATKALGKAGVKIAGKVLGRVPIIGGLLDFAFSLAMGEKPGRAAAKAVGATVGSALGTFIPIPFAGTILGGILGDIVGGALYDTLIEGNNKKTQAKAKGGSITRGGKRVGGSTGRSINIRRVKKPNKIVPQRTIVGKDVGGRKKIDDIYGKGSKKKRRNPVKLLKKASKAVKKNDNVLNGLPAAMFGAGIDMTLGQKPDKNLSVDIGNMFGSVIETSVNSEVSKLFTDVSSILTRAEGGTIPASRSLRKDDLNIGKKVGNEISQKLISSINSSFIDVLQNLNREFMIKEQEDGGGSGGGGGGDLPGDFSGDVSSMKAFNYFKSQGYADFQAAAIVGNLLQENRKMNPRLENSIGMKGIAQWDGNRWSNLEKFAERKNLDPYTLETQLQFIQYELKTGDGGLSQSTFKKTKTVEEATILFRKQYERPGEAEANDKQRIAYAKGVLKSSTFEYVPPGKVIPVVTGRFGEMRGDRKHGGSDLAVNEGTPLRAISDGKIIESAYESGWGNYTVFTDKNGIYHLYGHMKGAGRKPGNIKKGDILGYVGMTGRTSGPHLHWEAGTGWEGVIKNPFDPLQKYSVNAPFNTQKDKEKTQDKNKPSQIFEWNKPESTLLKNDGVSFKGGQFIKLGGGLFGSNQQVKVDDKTNVDLRANVKEFGLGRGTKEGQKKRAADGNYYEWRNGKWVYWDPVGGGNASLKVSPLSQEIAQLQGTYTDGMMLQNRIIYVDVPA